MTSIDIQAPTPDQLLLTQPYDFPYLRDDLYVAALAAWVLDNPEQSQYIQQTITPGLDAVSLTGYEVLWQKLHHLPGWEDTLWQGLGRRTHPVEECISLVSKCSGAESMAKMYCWLYSRLLQRGQTSALILSQKVAIQAAHYALSGIWKDSDLLMKQIFSHHRGKMFLVDGKHNWWGAAAKILNETMEKGKHTNHTLMKSGMLDSVVETYAGILLANHYPAGWEGDDCGYIFIQATQVSKETYSPLLFAWMSSGGDWEGLWNKGDEATRNLLFTHPLVRRHKLNSHIALRHDLERGDSRREL